MRHSVEMPSGQRLIFVREERFSHRKTWLAVLTILAAYALVATL